MKSADFIMYNCSSSGSKILGTYNNEINYIHCNLGVRVRQSTYINNFKRMRTLQCFSSRSHPKTTKFTGILKISKAIKLKF